MDRHKYKSIYNWKRRGVISEDFDKLYENHININNCQLCKVEFNNIIYNNKRCLDHDHATGLYRQTICNDCNRNFDRKANINNKTGHKNITFVNKTQRYLYQKKINNKRIQRSFKTLQDAIDFKVNIEK